MPGVIFKFNSYIFLAAICIPFIHCHFSKSESDIRKNFYLAAGLYSFLSITILANQKTIFAKIPI